jgi:hypothetical protein
MTYLYEALDGQGLPYLRPARIIDELPHGQRLFNMHKASQALAAKIELKLVQPAHYGRPVYHAFGLNLAAAKKHKHSALLLLLGSDLPIPE